MPEGDTIFRISQNLGRYMLQKSVTKVQLRSVPYAAELLLGKAVVDVTSIGKNLFIIFEGDFILHAHSKMLSSWHLYTPGVAWRRSARNAVAIIEVGDVIAVAFDVPVLQLSKGVERTLARFRSQLGSDLIRDELNLDLVAARFRRFAGDALIGEALLDQRIVSGIGNIYRCETLFKAKISPYRSAISISVEELGVMMETARSDLTFNATENPGVKRVFDSELEGTFVYGRGGLPCRICRTSIVRRVMGAPSEMVPRPVFYCPLCQV